MSDRPCSRCMFRYRSDNLTPLFPDTGKGAESECRRNAPGFTTADTGTTIALWPLTGEDDWCGDFKPWGTRR